MNKENWPYITPGIPDECFLRSEVPMTKEEVRILTLARLQLRKDSVVMDIGAGTGSISIESALLAKEGKVYAVEKNPKALELIKANIQNFGLDNVEIIGGDAPLCLELYFKEKEALALDGIIIGGSGGNLEEIIRYLKPRLKKGARIVINATLIETAYQSLELLKKYDFNSVGINGLFISRGRELGEKMALQGLNPIFIIWGTNN